MNEENATEGEIFQTFELSDGFRSVTIIVSKEEEERIHKGKSISSSRLKWVKFYIFTTMAFVYISIFGLHLVQHPTFGHREHLIASILT